MGRGDYNDVMVVHDENIGVIRAKLDELGIADNTIVLYSTDNGLHYISWPNAASTPFRSEKYINWEGGWRVLFFVRWPGRRGKQVGWRAGYYHDDYVRGDGQWKYKHLRFFPYFSTPVGEPWTRTSLEQSRFERF